MSDSKPARKYRPVPDEVFEALVHASNHGVGSRKLFQDALTKSGVENFDFQGRETKGQALSRVWQTLSQPEDDEIKNKIIVNILACKRDPRNEYVGEEAELNMKRLEELAVEHALVFRLPAFLIKQV